MDPSFLRTEVSGDLKDGLRKVLELFTQLDLVDNTNAGHVAALRTIQQELGDVNASLNQVIETFSYDIPANTFQLLLASLGRDTPKLGVHYLERNSVLHRNSEPQSYAHRDPDLQGWIARDTLARDTPGSTVAEREAEYDRVKTATEVANRQVAVTAPTWQLIQRDAPNDIRQEDSLLVFLDIQHKQVDWYSVVINLKKFGEPLGYNAGHYKRCLDRFIGFFAPALKPVTDELTHIELSKFLMRMCVPTPKHERLASQIQILVRNPAENIRTVLAQLQGMATAYYMDRTAAEQPSLINRIMVQGLMCFTTGQTHTSLSAAIDNAQLHGKVPDWLQLTESVIHSERIHGTPQITLPFKTAAPSTATLFHSTQYPVETSVSMQYTPVDYSVAPIDRAYDNTYHNAQRPHSSIHNFLGPANPRPVNRTVHNVFAPAPVAQQIAPYQPIVQQAAA
jgi:hypothetical protein